MDQRKHAITCEAQWPFTWKASSVFVVWGWWAQQDSNLRLPPCEGGTLPLSYAPGTTLRGLANRFDALALSF